MGGSESGSLAALKAELKDLIVKVANLQIASSDIDDRAPLFGGPPVQAAESAAAELDQKGGQSPTALGLDSIDLLEVVVHIDKRFGLRLENNDRGRAALTSVESLARALQDHLANQGSVQAGR